MTANLAIAQLLLSIALGTVTFIAGIFRYHRSQQRRRGAFKFQAYLWILTGLIALSSFMPLAHLYTEHLWFESLGHADVFWGLQQIRWGIFAVCFLIALGFMNINAAIANVLCPESREFRRWTHTQTFSFHRTVFCLTFIAALLLATPMLLLDDVYLRYRNQPAADSEPRIANREPRTAEEIMDGETVRLETANREPRTANRHFGKNRNFYLFSFPFHRWVSLWVQIMLWVTCIVVGLLYNFYYRRDAHTMQRVKRHIIFHGSMLWLLLLLVGGWRSYVHLWNKVYTSPLTQELSSLHGLFYVDFHLEGATRIYCGVLVGVGIAVVFNIFWRKRLLWYATLGVWGLSYLLLIHIYPLGLHLWDARINVLDKEEPYLQRHIEETRLAFELDTIRTEARVKGLATLDMITENAEIKKNIQIWDRRVLYEALREAQIQTHYDFHPYTDVDRYRVGDEYRQVLIAAREVSPEEDIVGWEPLKLQYTHGYGVCVSPVNEFIEDGFPNFWVADTPIRSDYDELSVQRPQIYYGEMTNNYVIVNSQRNINAAISRAAAQEAPETWEHRLRPPDTRPALCVCGRCEGGRSQGHYRRRRRSGPSARHDRVADYAAGARRSGVFGCAFRCRFPPFHRADARRRAGRDARHRQGWGEECRLAGSKHSCARRRADRCGADGVAAGPDRRRRRNPGLTAAAQPGKPVPPGSVIGILGGGQLGRMIALAAAPMGYRCAVLTPDADSPASQVAWQTIVAPYGDEAALARLADLSDVVTLEFENVPAATVAALAARVRTAPEDRVLAVTQDRLTEKALARDAGLATVAFAAVDNGDLSAMTESVAYPAILKTRRMGYDGKGQRRVETHEEAEEACRLLGDSLIAEAVCPFEMELSVIAARSPGGEIRAFDAVENEHENHILRTTRAPARIAETVRSEAQAAACRLACRLSLVGLLAVEFFWSPDAGLLVNEMAPRPHNSGHWTIEACRTGQFEQLVRAICGLPLGDPSRRFDAVMTNLLGAEAENWAALAADPAVHLHLYGKADARPGRKMGHVTRLLPLGSDKVECNG